MVPSATQKLKRTIAFFSPSADRRNGWGVMAFELCATYQRYYSAEITIHLYLPEVEKSKGYIKDIPIPQENIFFTLPSFAYSFRNPLRLISYLFKNPLRRPVDIIHCLDFPYAVSAWRAARSGTPYIITLCGTFLRPLYFPDHSLYQLVFTAAAQINAISDYTVKLAQKYFSTPSSKFSIIHPGVNCDRFFKVGNVDAVKKQFGENKKIILGVGALKVRKGFDIVIKALKKIHEVFPEAIYVIIGSGTAQASLQALAADLGLSQSVFFLTAVNDIDLPLYFQACDVYCHVPRAIDNAFEGFGIVYLEAGAASKPVVGSLSGGVPDAILEGITGTLVPEDDVLATTEAISALLKNPAQALVLGENGKKYAAVHDWKNIAGQHIALYNKFSKI